ncbi:MAG: hypothetical protein JWO75_3216 [Actinomycetia bacterium]|nr:hypothetical protein [Actinomycetes bacterium]
MTVLSALARAAAATAGRALPTKTVRHVHLSGRPLVLVAAQLAGEACAPLAVLAGDDREKPNLLAVYEPRDRTQRFEFAAGLAAIMLPAIDRHVEEDGNPDRADPYPDAPQLLVPNLPTVAFLRLLGRSTRFRKTEGEYAVPATVPLLGRWLTYFAERGEVTPSAQLLPMTAALADHWATGQSATEDANLAALLGWIDPPDGMTGHAAARAAEDPVRCPPAGPVTGPSFDNEVLGPILEAVREAALTGDGLTGDGARLGRARSAMDHALRSQLEPTWTLMWRAVDLLRALPAAAHVEQRWLSDRWSFTSQVAWIREGGAPQARRDSAVAAARRLARLEREQQRLAVERAYDDPLVMAEYRMTGEAVAGEVVEADPARLVAVSGKRPVLRPLVTVATADEVLFEPGAVLRSPPRPGQQATVTGVVPPGTSRTSADTAGGDGRTRVILELKGGMGRSLAPQPGSVPAVGEYVTYTSLRDDFQPPPKFPDKDDTPWTHGGPPPEYVPDDDDAREDWS